MMMKILLGQVIAKLFSLFPFLITLHPYVKDSFVCLWKGGNSRVALMIHWRTSLGRPCASSMQVHTHSSNSPPCRWSTLRVSLYCHPWPANEDLGSRVINGKVPGSLAGSLRQCWAPQCLKLVESYGFSISKFKVLLDVYLM